MYIGRNTQQWVDEFEGRKQITRPSNIQSLTKSITEIQDPKLQQSNFMKFMSQISKGEVEFVDNQVIHKSPSAIQVRLEL